MAVHVEHTRWAADAGSCGPDSIHGHVFAFVVIGRDGTREIRAVDLAGGPAVTVTGPSATSGNEPIDISPDGSLIATSKAVRTLSEVWLLKPDR